MTGGCVNAFGAVDLVHGVSAERGSEEGVDQLAEEVEGLPNISGNESRVEAAMAGRGEPVFPTPGNPFEGVVSAFAVALHMHQPLIPAGGPELGSAAVIGQSAIHAGQPGRRGEP